MQNKRFDNCIHLEIQCPPEVRNYHILKLLLQPLVENSITHGLQNNPGTITIRLSQEKAFLNIVITDNGVGISAEKQAKIRLYQELKLTSSSQGGYGLTNIQERLFHYYGTESLLRFSSVLGQGTAVAIALPLEKVL